MHKRASNAFSVLQAIAAVVCFSIILWSLGITSFRFAEAANVSAFSDTLSSSQPSVAADHTITFTTPSGVANGSSITIDFSDGPFIPGTVDFTDIDVATSTDYTVGTSTCIGGQEIGAGFTGTTLTLTFCAAGGASLPANATTTIQIGLNADGGDAQITNPAVPGTGTSYAIVLTAGADTGTTRVAILNKVTVTASVDTYFEFTVAGVGGGSTVNGTTTTGSSSANIIPFGVLQPGVASTAAQDLTVQTNARNGYTVTVVADGQLDSAGNLADIDGFIEGSFETVPQSWVAPSPVVGDEWTYGHWGLTSTDADLGFGSQQYVSASTSPVTVLSHDGPVDGVATPEAGTSTARIGYTVQITSLQEAADDYEATLTYVATPVF